MDFDPGLTTFIIAAVIILILVFVVVVGSKFERDVKKDFEEKYKDDSP